MSLLGNSFLTIYQKIIVVLWEICHLSPSVFIPGFTLTEDGAKASACAQRIGLTRDDLISEKDRSKYAVGPDIDIGAVQNALVHVSSPTGITKYRLLLEAIVAHAIYEEGASFESMITEQMAEKVAQLPTSTVGTKIRYVAILGAVMVSGNRKRQKVMNSNVQDLFMQSIAACLTLDALYLAVGIYEGSRTADGK